MRANNVVPFTPRGRHTVTDQPTDMAAETEPTRAVPSPVAPLQTAVYTVKELAHLLSLSLGSTYALIRTGDIPARKMGGRWVVPKQRFHTWLNELPEGSTDDLEDEFKRLHNL